MEPQRLRSQTAELVYAVQPALYDRPGLVDLRLHDFQQRELGTAPVEILIEAGYCEITVPIEVVGKKSRGQLHGDHAWRQMDQLELSPANQAACKTRQ